ncbi:MAG: hypothetical protein V4439_04165 [Patescibacteria group bacterium]
MVIQIKEQLVALKFSLSIGQKIVTKIEERFLIKFENLSTLDEQKQFLKNEAIYLYLKNFWQQYEFLIKKVEAEEDLKNFQFYIPLTRILLENYGELLYLVNQDEKTQLGIFIGKYLLYFSDMFRFVAIESTELKDEYDRFLKLMGGVLSSEDISFPSDINSFSNGFLERNGFSFPRFEQIFNQPYFTIQSSKTLALWKKDSPSTFYNKYYRSHSNYTHPSFTNQMSGATNNEVFWIVQFMYIMAQLMVELCNTKVFVGEFQSEYEKLVAEVKISYPILQSMWHTTPRA